MTNGDRPPRPATRRLAPPGLATSVAWHRPPPRPSPPHSCCSPPRPRPSAGSSMTVSYLGVNCVGEVPSSSANRLSGVLLRPSPGRGSSGTSTRWKAPRGVVGRATDHRSHARNRARDHRRLCRGGHDEPLQLSPRPSRLRPGRSWRTAITVLCGLADLLSAARSLSGATRALTPRARQRSAAGVAISLLGMGLAFLYDEPPPPTSSLERLPQGIAGAHAVGVADGGPRPAPPGLEHRRVVTCALSALHRHARLQAIPLLALLLERGRPGASRCCATLSLRRGLVLTGARGLPRHGRAFVTMQALRGQSIVAPDALNPVARSHHRRAHSGRLRSACLSPAPRPRCRTRFLSTVARSHAPAPLAFSRAWHSHAATARSAFGPPNRARLLRRSRSRPAPGIPAPTRATSVRRPIRRGVRRPAELTLAGFSTMLWASARASARRSSSGFLSAVRSRRPASTSAATPSILVTPHTPLDGRPPADRLPRTPAASRAAHRPARPRCSTARGGVGANHRPLFAPLGWRPKRQEVRASITERRSSACASRGQSADPRCCSRPARAGAGPPAAAAKPCWLAAHAAVPSRSALGACSPAHSVRPPAKVA